MKLANLLALVVVAGISAAIGYFVGTDMSGMKAEEPAKVEEAKQEAPAQTEAKAEPADPNDKLLATVDGAEIRESHVRSMYDGLPAQYKQAPFPMIKAQLVEQLVSMRMIQNAAKAEGYDAQADFEARVDDVRLQLLQEYYLQKKIDEAVTDAAVQGEYDKVVADFKAEQEVRARHILLKEEAEAKDVVAKLDAGGDFVELAKELSTGPSGPNGGDLGYFVKGRMVKEFSEAAFALEIGEYTKEPVQTQFGWHIILMEDSRQTQPPSLDSMREQIQQNLSGQTVNALLDDLKAKAKVDIVQEAPKEEEKKEN